MPATRDEASPPGAGSPTSRVRGRDLRMVPIAAAVWMCSIGAVFVPSASPAFAAVLWSIAVGGAGAAIVLVCARRSDVGARRAQADPASEGARTGAMAWTTCRRRARRHPGLRGDRARALLALTVAGAAMGAVAVTHVALQQPARGNVAGAVADGAELVRVTATVTGKVREVGGVLWMDAEASALRAGADVLPVPVAVTVAVDPGAVSGELLDLGSVIEARGAARPGEPGQRATLVLFAGRLETTTPPPAALLVASRARDGFVERVVAGLPEPGSGLLPGLAVGDTRAVPAELDAAMKTASLAHLVAVSGSNCLIVTGVVYALASLARLPRWARASAAATGLGAFVVLVTPEPSVVRAAAMAMIGLTAMLLGRAGAGCAVLSLAVVVLLAADPWLATSYGFVLSAAATGALLLLSGPLADGMSRRMPRPLALAIAVPLSAQLVCGPVIVLLAPEAALYGVVANLIAAPAAPLATVVGLLACLLQAIPLLSQGLAAIAWLPSSWIAQTALVFSAMPGARLPWWGGPAGAAALALVGVCISVVVIAPPASIGAAAHRASWRLARTAAGAVLAVVAGIAAGSAMLGGIAAPLTVPREWTIAMCDVGQGDAVVIRSADEVALVDTGPEPELLEACLARLGVRRIDMLVVTHFDLDHVGSVRALSGRVRTALHGPLGDDDAGWLGSLDGARVTQASAGMTGTLGEARWRVLWPGASNAFEDGNDASVVMEFSGGGVPRVLLLGDLSAAAQSALRAAGSLAADYPVVKVSHHGSADQRAQLYRDARPDVALIGVGADNTYGHPSDAILAELAGIGATVARTDENGMVLVGSEDGALSLWRERAPPAAVEVGVGGRR